MVLSWSLFFRLEEVVTLAVDHITQSPVISLVVSLATLPEQSPRVLQSPTSHLGLAVAFTRWDGAEG